MPQTRHIIRVELLSRGDEPLARGSFTVDGEPLELDEDRALELALASEHLDLDAPGGFIRWKGHLIPRDRFGGLTVIVDSASRLDPDSLAAASANRAEHLRREAERILFEAEELEAAAERARAADEDDDELDDELEEDRPAR
jgi:hypothetical protein